MPDQLLFDHGLDDADELAFQLAWAVAHGMDARVELLARHGVSPDTELGWDVDRRARTDVPSDQEWETVLHAAAGNGNTGMVELLLKLGADATLTDCRFEATPAAWAEHFGHREVATLLSARSG